MTLTACNTVNYGLRMDTTPVKRWPKRLFAHIGLDFWCGLAHIRAIGGLLGLDLPRTALPTRRVAANSQIPCGACGNPSHDCPSVQRYDFGRNRPVAHKRLFRALLTQLHPGGIWNPGTRKRQGRKDLRRGPEYGPEPERGFSLRESHLSTGYTQA